MRELLLAAMPCLPRNSTYGLADAIGISQATIMRLINDNRVPKEPTLQKIAKAFALEITEVRAMAGRQAGERVPFVLPEAFDQLTLRQRQVLLAAGWAYLESPGRRETR